MLIHTPNLRISTCTPEQLDAIVRDPKSLAALLNVSIPDGWPYFPQAYPHLRELLKQDPLRPYSGWWLYLFVRPEERALVGCGGFQDKPSADGVVEVGCEIAPAYRGRGYASEALGALVRYAFTRPEVEAVDAHSGPADSASARVLAKCGMQVIGKDQDARAGQILHWRITRDEYLRGRQRKVA
ncbi:MAG TPA: GNAT family protein [Burkholderiales bacterium]|jgi:RimJ/RimL family protein N-acetyltransferase|nr:GNAT family protein [Burkholderiales bacterium]